MVPLSVLDLVPVVEGATPRDALRNSLDLARHAERLGYRRYWVAEHHNMPAIASAATAVVIGYIAGGTSAIRVGAGGIMLPNHPPLVIAEQFGTLESLYPGRIDLGLGRAPGTDDKTIRAMRRNPEDAAHFPQDVQELQAFLGPVADGQRIQAVPGGNLRIPIWILGSSTYGAQLAAMLGLPYAFADFISPGGAELASGYRDAGVPTAFYIHPWELDPDQPRLDAPLLTRVRHYRGLRDTASKIDRLLSETRFSSIAHGIHAMMSAVTEAAPAGPRTSDGLRQAAL